MTADLSGKRYGRWLVLSPAGQRSYHCSMWNCRCDCGTERVVAAGNLKHGGSRSCGCLKRELTKQRWPEARAARGES